MAQLQATLRDNAGLGLLLHQAIASRFGLNPTDLKTLDLARRETELTAGGIAEVTGLSNSAVTAVLDRLERAGFVERVRDSRNRRRVLVISTGRYELAMRDAYTPLTRVMRELLAGYDHEQLALFLDFTVRIGEATREALRETARLPT